MRTQTPQRPWRLTKSAVVAAAVLMATPATWAQTNTFRMLCMTHGASWIEPVGDHERHGLQDGQATCTVQGGPLDGATVTQKVLWEYRSGVGTLHASHSVYRKPGAMAVGVSRQGTLNFQFTDGRVTGWSSQGSVAFPMVAGSAAPLANKTAQWTGQPTGPHTYTMEFTVEP